MFLVGPSGFQSWFLLAEWPLAHSLISLKVSRVINKTWMRMPYGDILRAGDWHTRDPILDKLQLLLLSTCLVSGNVFNASICLLFSLPLAPHPHHLLYLTEVASLSPQVLHPKLEGFLDSFPSFSNQHNGRLYGLCLSQYVMSIYFSLSLLPSF